MVSFNQYTRPSGMKNCKISQHCVFACKTRRTHLAVKREERGRLAGFECSVHLIPFFRRIFNRAGEKGFGEDGAIRTRTACEIERNMNPAAEKVSETCSKRWY